MLTPHEFKPVVLARPSYRLWEWSCTCGAPCTSPRTRSKIGAMLGFWRDHVFPDVEPPRHTCTLHEGGFENSLRWTCSCGEYGDPRGHANERWAWQSHQKHVNAALVKWYRARWLNMVHALDPDAHYEFLRAEQRQKDRDEQARKAALREKWRQDDIRYALNELI